MREAMTEARRGEHGQRARRGEHGQRAHDGEQR